MRKRLVTTILTAGIVAAARIAAADEYDALRNTITTTTDPVEFGRALNQFRDAFHTDCILKETGKGSHCDAIRQLEAQWLGRREVVAKANKRCKKHAKAIVARDFESMIGAPGECVYIGIGLPIDINSTTTAQTVHEQWVYHGLYIYVDNGKITAVQRH